jgi:hypothetical protein
MRPYPFKSFDDAVAFINYELAIVAGCRGERGYMKRKTNWVSRNLMLKNKKDLLSEKTEKI